MELFEAVLLASKKLCYFLGQSMETRRAAEPPYFGWPPKKHCWLVLFIFCGLPEKNTSFFLFLAGLSAKDWKVQLSIGLTLGSGRVGTGILTPERPPQHERERERNRKIKRD